jgi:hypothetical protein
MSQIRVFLSPISKFIHSTSKRERSSAFGEHRWLEHSCPSLSKGVQQQARTLGKYLGFYRMPICSTRGSMKRKEYAEIREGKRRNDEYLHSEMSNSFNNQKNVELETIKTH